MVHRVVAAVASAALLTSCGPPPEPPTPPPLDPVGTFDVMIDAQGTSVSGVMVIRGSADEGYTGNIDTDMGGASLTNIVVAQQTLTFSIPDAGADVELVFEGDGFSGGMTGAMGEAIWAGKRRGER